MLLRYAIFLLLAALAVSMNQASAAVRKIPQQYTTVQAAVNASVSGDTIEILAGVYTGRTAIAVFPTGKNNLTIRAINGKARMDATASLIANGKAIWVIQGSNTTIENIEFFNARVTSRNGAGIRQEGAGLIVRGSYFHDNENGILAGRNLNSDIVIEHSEFDRNGYGDGYTHNIYIGEVRNFTLRHSYSHRAKVGHNVKSRAVSNYILYNRLTDETPDPAYSLDLPNGANAYVIGNLFHQHASTVNNSAILSYAAESAVQGKLYVINNTFVNYRAGGTFVQVRANSAVLKNNIFLGPGVAINGTHIASNNLIDQRADPNTSTDLIKPSTYDYHLTSISKAKNAGIDPGRADTGYLLRPVWQYVSVTMKENRNIVGQMDIGAYESAK